MCQRNPETLDGWPRNREAERMEEGQGQKRRKCMSRAPGNIALGGERKQEGNIQNGGRETFKMVVTGW